MVDMGNSCHYKQKWKGKVTLELQSQIRNRWFVCFHVSEIILGSTKQQIFQPIFSQKRIEINYTQKSNLLGTQLQKDSCHNRRLYLTAKKYQQSHKNSSPFPLKCLPVICDSRLMQYMTQVTIQKTRCLSQASDLLKKKLWKGH